MGEGESSSVVRRIQTVLELRETGLMFPLRRTGEGRLSVLRLLPVLVFCTNP